MSAIRVATRRSALALRQTEWVVNQLTGLHPDARFEIVPMVTRGDLIQDVALSKVGGKGLFVSELERALLDGHAEIAVHSLKDVPGELAPGLVLGAIPEREDPRDAIILSSGIDDWHALPADCLIGTSSLRRQAQLRTLRPDFRFDPLRGNIDTRLRRVQQGNLDAIVLAAAGLKRLGRADEISALLSAEECLPAIGQGALGIECRADHPVRQLLQAFHHAPSGLATAAERELLLRLNGGCQVPIAGYAILNGTTIHLRAYVADAEGGRYWRSEASGSDPIEVGRAAGKSVV